MTAKVTLLRGETPVVVQKASAGVQRAIGKLVRLLEDEDSTVFEEACGALLALGQSAIVGPLTGALVRTTSPRLRVAILLLLDGLDAGHDQIIAMSVKRALRRERHPDVATRMQLLSIKKGARLLGATSLATSGSTMAPDTVASLEDQELRHQG
jgi:hypothetical protein